MNYNYHNFKSKCC